MSVENINEDFGFPTLQQNYACPLHLLQEPTLICKTDVQVLTWKVLCKKLLVIRKGLVPRFFRAGKWDKENPHGLRKAAEHLVGETPTSVRCFPGMSTDQYKLRHRITLSLIRSTLVNKPANDNPKIL